MKAFDTDVLTEILLGDAIYVERAARIPLDEQVVPILVVEEMIRGRLNVIRQSEAGKARIAIDQAYRYFEQTLQDLRQVKVLSYNSHAEAHFQILRKQKLRMGSQDLRIAAVCVVHSATLISRNRRDFERVPGLRVEFWE
jgi:tRNA(fMet)-specific endonuclease VapC